MESEYRNILRKNYTAIYEYNLQKYNYMKTKHRNYSSGNNLLTELCAK